MEEALVWVFRAVGIHMIVLPIITNHQHPVMVWYNNIVDDSTTTQHFILLVPKIIVKREHGWHIWGRLYTNSSRLWYCILRKHHLPSPTFGGVLIPNKPSKGINFPAHLFLGTTPSSMVWILMRRVLLASLLDSKNISTVPTILYQLRFWWGYSYICTVTQYMYKYVWNTAYSICIFSRTI